MQPLAAGRFAEADQPSVSRRARSSRAPSVTALKSRSGAGSKSKIDRPGTSGASGSQFHGYSSSAATWATATSPSTVSICR